MSLDQQTRKLQTYIQNHQDISAISEKDIAPVYQECIDCLTDHNHLYYIQNNPIISDKEYDDLFSYIKKIEEYLPHLISSNSPTQTLVGQISEGFRQANHEYSMLSLQNTYNAQDLRERNTRILKILEKENYGKQIYYHIEPKYDGISIELVYEKGKLIQAITRGDGETGEDVTENVKTIQNLKNVKVDFPGKIYFRGEIVLPKSEFIRINQKREKENMPPFANTRNVAAGSIKQLDSSITAKRNLKCYVYDAKVSNEAKDNIDWKLWLDIEIDGVDYIKKCGFETIIFISKTFKDIEKIIEFCENTEIEEKLRKDFPDIDFDGLVVKVDEQSKSEIEYQTYNNARTILGATDHHPRRAVAYKFPAQQISTQIQSVDFQVGRTGIITPVANLTPIQLSGVTIKRVSLHNQDFIDNKNIHINDYVRIQRSGEVIPYIVGVIQDRRPDDTQKIQSPTQCPVCQTATTRIDMHTYCPNPSCPAQLKERIEHFVSKPCMNIEGIGESIIDILVEHNIVHNVADLYIILDPQIQSTLRRFPGFADKKVYEIAQQLENSKNEPLRRLLHGLSIPNIGKKIAMSIQEALQTEHKEDNITTNTIIKYLINTEFLNNIYGIGDKIVQGLAEFIADPKNIELIQELEQHGLNFSPHDTTKNQKSPFNGKHFCITGTFRVSRDHIIQACEKEGMVFDNSPIQKTNIFFVGEKAGSKLSKAQEMHIPILTNREDIKMQYPFLQNIPQTQKSTGPQAQSLF